MAVRGGPTLTEINVIRHSVFVLVQTIGGKTSPNISAQKWGGGAVVNGVLL